MAIDEETRALLQELAASLKETQAALELVVTTTEEARIQPEIKSCLVRAGSRLGEFERRLGQPEASPSDAEPIEPQVLGE